MMKLRYLSIALVLLVSLHRSEAGQSGKDMTKLQDVSWPSPPARADLSLAGGAAVELNFSESGRYLCASWLPEVPGDYTKVLRTNAVFDLQGKQIPQATDATGQLVGEYVRMFPGVAWRKRFADFVKNGDGGRTTMWGFKQDYSMGVRFLKPKKSDFALGTVECWRFEPSEKKLWAVSLPEESSKSGLVVFFEWKKQPCVLIALKFAEGYVLSVEDGKVLHSFACGQPDTKEDPVERDEAEAAAYMRKFRLGGETEDWWFSPSELAFDPVKGLLACGDGIKSPRFRVDSVGPPHKIIFEAKWDQHPRRPWGGEWEVSSLYFDAAGKYLVVGYYFGGRLTSKYFRPVEIYDTTSWKIVWSANHPEIRSHHPPRISPDGRTLALTRGKWLEIGPFQPKEMKEK